MKLYFELCTPSWHRHLRRKLFDAWFYRPEEHSSGGVGFRLPFLQVCFMWGLREHVHHRGSRA